MSDAKKSLIGGGVGLAVGTAMFVSLWLILLDGVLGIGLNLSTDWYVPLIAIGAPVVTGIIYGPGDIDDWGGGIWLLIWDLIRRAVATNLVVFIGGIWLGFIWMLITEPAGWFFYALIGGVITAPGVIIIRVFWD